MNVDVKSSGFLVPAVELSPPRLQLSRALAKFLRNAARFVASMQAAQIVAQRAERYYAMSDRELAQLGLSRRDVPAELLRVLTQHQGH